MLGSEPAPSPSSREEITRQLGTLGVRPGGVLLVHLSFRAVAPSRVGRSAWSARSGTRSDPMAPW